MKVHQPDCSMLLAAIMTLGLRASAQLRFRQDGVCAPAAVPPSKLLQGVRSQQSCSVECALRSDCAVYGFLSSSSECRMGNTEDLLTSWQTPADTSTSCITQLNPRLPGVLSFRSSLLAYLDFRIGQTNLVSSARFGVSGSSPGVTFDSSGAIFPPIAGAASNFVELRTAAASGSNEAFGDLLGRGRNFSVYASVKRLGNQAQSYYMMTDCGDYTKIRGAFAHSAGLEVMTHGLSTPNELTLYSGNVTTPETTGQIAVSTGVVFDGSKFSAVYYNGTMMGVVNYAVPYPPTYTGNPECIRLGYSVNAPDSLVGRYVCFAIARRMLTAKEFAELDALCV